MRVFFLSYWGLALLCFSAQASSQNFLETLGFASCLSEVQPRTDINDLARRYRFSEIDGLLPYLAFYPGKRFPVLKTVIQKSAHRRWAVAWEPLEAEFASKLYARALSAQPGTLTPNILFRDALLVCEAHDRHRDAFCAALTTHNVLRTLGRHHTAIEIFRQGKTLKVIDRNPEWFRIDSILWRERAIEIATALTEFESGNTSVRYGDWYHFFGAFTFAVHEAAVLGTVKTARFASRMNKILNPWVLGTKENEAKATLDLDSVSVAWHYLKATPSSQVWDCSSRRSYVAR